MTLVLTNANLIDSLSPQATPESSVTVEEGRIVEILDGSRSPSTQNADVIDLKGSYLLPGLWDAHVHIEWPRLVNPTVAEQVLQYGYNSRVGMTEAGIIGYRTGGTAHYIDVALRDAYNAGRFVGPRIFASGYFLTTTGGHALAADWSRECDGVDAFLQAVRDQIKGGVDHIKLNLTGGLRGPYWDRHWQSFFLPAELEAAFNISHQRGYKVMCHAANPDAVKSALHGGAHTVEHGYIMDEECISLFLEKETWYLPTLGISHLTPSQADTQWEKRWVEEHNLTPDLVKRSEDAVDEHRKWFQRALEAGVKMAVGSDLTPIKDGALLEMDLWVKDGATPWQALVGATRSAAEVCGVGDDLGTVEVGKLADLIVVRQNPLESVDNLRSLELVFKEGKIVANHRKDVA